MSCRPHWDSAPESGLAGLRTYDGGIWAGDSGRGEVGADVSADEDVTVLSGVDWGDWKLTEEP